VQEQLDRLVNQKLLDMEQRLKDEQCRSLMAQKERWIHYAESSARADRDPGAQLEDVRLSLRARIRWR